MVEYVIPMVIAAVVGATVLYVLSPEGMAATWRAASCLGVAE